MPAARDDLVAPGTPDEVEITDQPRKPVFDPTVGIPLETDFPRDRANEPPHRLVVIGDSLSQGFQSGAVYNTDVSFPAIIATELGWFDHYEYPRYGGPGGLPLNIEYLLRDLERRYGDAVNWWEAPGAIFHARRLMDEIEDYWERGPGSDAPTTGTIHDLAVYGWDLRDALERTAASCRDALEKPKDDPIKQLVQNDSARAALRVYPSARDRAHDTLFAAAERLGEDTNDGKADRGIETLVIFLGANNALQAVTELRVTWSEDNGFRDLRKKGAYTVWRPSHFRQELDEVVAAVRRVPARHVIWCTVPHVTVVPVARGVGGKLGPGSRYFPYYTRPWIDPERFDPGKDPCITGAQARAVDSTIDQYNEDIARAVADARQGNLEGDDGRGRDWYLLDTAGLLDRLAARRYIEDPDARPSWWSPYPLPPALASLKPPPDSRFLTSNGEGGRERGGLFSLDGVHPTTIGYGLIAQEMVNIMRRAGVVFRHIDGAPRRDPVTVDFDRLIRRDSLALKPPQNLSPGLKTLGWADEALDAIKRALRVTA
ncbi:MAG TPA: hypothetical protein VFD59_21285 [Nocardioidaceae bacterium]|nr:hypothetical protein [Nocardioidaceae bacterium]